MGKSKVYVISTLHTDVSIKKETELGRFQVCKTVEVINNQEHKCDEDKQTAQVFSLQESLQNEKDIKQHLAPTSRPDLERELVNVLLLHKAAVALPGDTLVKQLCCNTGSNSSQEHSPFTFPLTDYRILNLPLRMKMIEDMLSQDVIEPSNNEWNIPPILVSKPDGTMRPVIDYRELNKKIIPDRLPLRVISDVLRSLGTSNKLFSTIDKKSAFKQIELDEASRPLTAFTTPRGHYQFRRMPFGLSNSPLTYMRLMNNVLQDLIGKTASVFLDDILIVSQTEERFHKLNQVFTRLVPAGLKIRLENVVFYKRKLFTWVIKSAVKV